MKTKTLFCSMAVSCSFLVGFIHVRDKDTEKTAYSIHDTAYCSHDSKVPILVQCNVISLISLLQHIITNVIVGYGQI